MKLIISTLCREREREISLKWWDSLENSSGATMTRRFRVYAQCDYQKATLFRFFFFFFGWGFHRFPLHSPFHSVFSHEKSLALNAVRMQHCLFEITVLLPPSLSLSFSFSLDWFRRGHLRIFRRRLTRWNFRPFNRGPLPCRSRRRSRLIFRAGSDRAL